MSTRNGLYEFEDSSFSNEATHERHCKGVVGKPELASEVALARAGDIIVGRNGVRELSLRLDAGDIAWADAAERVIDGGSG